MGEYAQFASVPQREERHGIDIRHPRFLRIPKVGMNVAPLLMAATLRSELERRFGYYLQRTLDEIRPEYTFDVSCQGSVPEAIICFLEGRDWESTVRNAVSLGGDSDTMACIAGGIAEGFYGPVSSAIREQVRSLLTDELWEATERFYRCFVDPRLAG